MQSRPCSPLSKWPPLLWSAHLDPPADGGGRGRQAAGRGIPASEARALQGAEDPVMTSRLPLLPPL